MDSIYIINESDKFANVKFEKKTAIDEEQSMHVFDLKYYERGLKQIEDLDDGEIQIGNIKMKR
jgi:hypothetical protein